MSTCNSNLFLPPTCPRGKTRGNWSRKIRNRYVFWSSLDYFNHISVRTSGHTDISLRKGALTKSISRLMERWLFIPSGDHSRFTYRAPYALSITATFRLRLFNIIKFLMSFLVVTSFKIFFRKVYYFKNYTGHIIKYFL